VSERDYANGHLYCAINTLVALETLARTPLTIPQLAEQDDVLVHGGLTFATRRAGT
jgi:hypothetical protein